MAKTLHNDNSDLGNDEFIVNNSSQSDDGIITIPFAKELDEDSFSKRASIIMDIISFPYGKEIMAVLLFVLLAFGQSFGATKTATKAGLWSDPNIWSPAGVPVSTDDVVIGLTANGTVSVSWPTTVHSLDLGDNHAKDMTLKLTSSAASLTVTGVFRLNPSNKGQHFYLDAGAGTVNINGTFPTWNTGGEDYIKISSGTVNFTPALSLTHDHQRIIFSNNGTVTFNSSFSMADKDNLLLASGCVVNFKGSYTVSGDAKDWAGIGTANFYSTGTITPTKNITFNDVNFIASCSTTLASAAGTVVIGGNVVLNTGSTFTANDNFTLKGNWTNNGGTLSAGAITVTLGGSSQTIEGTNSTTWPTLMVGLTGGGTYNTSVLFKKSGTIGTLTLNGNDRNRTVTLNDASVSLTITGNVTLNQPTKDNLSDALMVNAGSVTINGNLVFVGGTNTDRRFTKVAVTSGSFTLGGTLTWAANNKILAELITTVTGTITFNSSITMGGGSGTITAYDAGRIIFNGSTAPSLSFGGSGNGAALNTAANSVIKFNKGLTATTTALTFNADAIAEFTGTGTVTPTAAITFGDVKIDASASVTMAGNVTVKGDWTNLGGTFTPSTYSVTFGSAFDQNISNTSGTNTFYKLITSSYSTAELIMHNNLVITNNLTMSGGYINMGGATLTLGSGSGASLTRTGGLAHSGTFKRWLPTGAITSTSGSYYGLFPVGVDTANSNTGYRPVEINTTSNVTTAGYVMVSDTNALPITLVTYTDNTGTAIQAISNNRTAISTSGLAGGTYTLHVWLDGLSSMGVTTDERLETYTNGVMGSVGTHVATAGTVAAPIIKRSGLTASNLNNVFVIGTRDRTTTPLRLYYYSRKSGNWADATPLIGTWSYAVGSNGAACGCVPTNDGYVIINSGHTVTCNTSATVDYVDIMDGGTLQDTGTLINLNINQDLTLYGTGKFTCTGSMYVGNQAQLSGHSSGKLKVNKKLKMIIGSSFTNSGSGDLDLPGDVELNGTINLGNGHMKLRGQGRKFTGVGTITSTGGKVKVCKSLKFDAATVLTIGSTSANVDLDIDSGSLATNNGHLIINGNITGHSSADTLLNEAGSTLEVTGNVLSSGNLSASVGPNSIKYNGGGTQTIKAPLASYYNLEIANAGVKSLAADMDVVGTLTIKNDAELNAGTYALSGDAGLVMSGNSTLRMTRSVTGEYPELGGEYSLTGGRFVLTQSADTAYIKSAHYYALKLIGAGKMELSGVTQIDSSLEIGGSSIILNNKSLSIGKTFKYSSSGTSAFYGDISAGDFNMSSGIIADSGYTLTLLNATGWNQSGGSYRSTGKVKFGGSAAQTISGSIAPAFYNLSISNSAGVTINTTANSPTTVAGELRLNGGKLHTTAANKLKLLYGASCNGGSTIDFVDGPMIKQGNDDFDFPIGDGNYRGRAGISGLTDSTTEVNAQYFHTAYSDLNHVPQSVGSISPMEYWEISRSVSSDSLKLALYWDDAVTNGLNCSSLHLVHYKNNQWNDEPAEMISGGTCDGGGSGGIITTGYLTSFSPFGFGDGSGALPVKLLLFDAKPSGKTVRTYWITELEINNDYFTIERSTDGVNFKAIGIEKGHGNSTEQLTYEWFDLAPINGTSYYRLKQTDFDGSSSYSGIIVVVMGGTSEGAVIVYPNPVESEIFINVKNPSTEIELNVYEATGRQVYGRTFPADSGSKDHTINIQTSYFLQTRGLYMVEVKTGGEVYKQRLVVK